MPRRNPSSPFFLRPSPWLLGLCGLGACSDNDRSPPVGPSPQPVLVGKPAFVDVDGDGAVGANDTVIVRFDRPVRVQRSAPPFDTVVAGDQLGAGAQLQPGDRADEVRVVLGTGAHLRAAGRFSGSGAGAPSGLRLREDDAIVGDGSGVPPVPEPGLDLIPGFKIAPLPPGTQTPVEGEGVAAGDIDGDGDLDLVVVRDGGTATVFLNDGDAVFTAGQQFGEGRAVALGDLDGDGDPDAVLGSDNGPSTVWRNAAGTFQLAGNLGSARTVAVAIGDLDGDGDADVAAGNGPADPDAIWLNDGTGAFTAGQTVGAGNTHTVTLADVDGDGDLDLLQGRSGPSQIWLNDGQATFTGGPTIGSGNTHSIAAGDIDCDGDLDVITAGRDPAELWRNDGGSFTSTGKLANAATDAVRLIDFDGDGHLDVYAANTNGQDDELWLIDHDMRLQFSGITVVNGSTNDAVVGDFDGDGDFDIITLGDGAMALLASSLSSSRGTPSFTAGTAQVGRGPGIDLSIADFDRDGAIDAVETFGSAAATVVWSNDGQAVFSEAALLGNNERGAVADIDHDGDADFLATDPANGIRLWRNAGTALPAAAVTVSAVGGVALAVHDVDRDGDLDLVHARGTAGPAEVWLNDGAGAFTLSAAPALPADVNNVTVADVDRDGDGDLLLATSLGLRVATNAGTGTFTAGAAIGSVALRTVVTGDVDHDGDLDVAVGGDTGHAIWRNDGGVLTVVAPAGAVTRALVLIDIDGDGDLDVLRGGDGADEWWRNDAGTFVLAPITLSAGPTSDFAVADLDCDGDLDVLVADGSPAGGLRVFVRD